VLRIDRQTAIARVERRLPLALVGTDLREQRELVGIVRVQ
jgi:hypothetical protein